MVLEENGNTFSMYIREGENVSTFSNSIKKRMEVPSVTQ